MPAVWPATLPQRLSLNGYNESPPNNLLRTEMDVGLAKHRKRFTAAPRNVHGSVLVDDTQIQTLDDFYTATLKSGVDAFDWVEPRAGTAASFRFRSPPSYRLSIPGVWSASLDLEILP